MTTDPLAAVGLVLLVLFVVLSWLTRRLEGGSLRRSNRDRIALTAHHTVHVVEAGGLRLLVGTGPGAAPQVLANLGEIDADEGAQAEASAPVWHRPALDLLGRLGAVGGR